VATTGRIFQQIYTRDREGIFRTNEGLDTVAKSPSLDNSFIKKVLHPFCFYNAPHELRVRAEQDLAQYPKALTMFPVETGELIVGRSLYAGSDFTGQRNTFLTHNFVIPSELKDEFVKNPAKIFRIRGFLERYDIQEGKELPELADLDYDRTLEGYAPDALLEQLGITETIFKQLLASMMLSISGKKKVYVILNVDIAETSVAATRLLELLFHCLPYELRRNCGFMTYNNEPQGKKYIHIMFVEKGSIRPLDRNIEKDYLFDLPNDRIANIDASSSNSEYLDYAWRYRNEPEMLNAFYDFADEALTGADEYDRLALSTYYKLFALYQIEQGNQQAYESNKEAVLESLNSFLAAEPEKVQPRLNSIMQKLLEQEYRMIRTEYTPSIGVIQSSMQYGLHANDAVKKQLIEFWVLAIYNGWQQQDAGYTAQIYDRLLAQGNLFDASIEFMYGQAYFEQVLQDYINTRFTKVKDAERFEQELLFWVKHHPAMLNSVMFENAALRRIDEMFTKQAASRDSRALYDVITRTFDKHPDLGIDQLCASLVSRLIVQTLNEIEPNPTNEEELKDLKFLFIIPRAELMAELTTRGRGNWKILHVVIQVVTREEIQASELVKEFEDLAPAELRKAQELLQKIYRGKVREEMYGKLIYAFYESNHEKFSNDSYDQFQYEMLLEYLFINADEEGVYSFLLWSSTQSGFTVGRQVLPGYERAINNYFRKHDDKAFKNRQTAATLMAVRHPGMLKLFKAIKLDQSNPIVRFMAKHKKQFRLTLLFAIVIALLTVVIILVRTLIHAFSGDDTPQDNVVTPPPTTVVSPLPAPAVSETPGVTPTPDGAGTVVPPASTPSNSGVPSTTPSPSAGVSTTPSPAVKK